MENDPSQKPGSRENMLAIALVLLVGGGMLFFLYMISFGIVGNILIGAGAIVVVGALHYLVWGRFLSDEIAAEREALRRQDAREAKASRVKMADAIQDLERTQGVQEK